MTADAEKAPTLRAALVPGEIRAGCRRRRPFRSAGKRRACALECQPPVERRDAAGRPWPDQGNGRISSQLHRDDGRANQPADRSGAHRSRRSCRLDADPDRSSAGQGGARGGNRQAIRPSPRRSSTIRRATGGRTSKARRPPLRSGAIFWMRPATCRRMSRRRSATVRLQYFRPQRAGDRHAQAAGLLARAEERADPSLHSLQPNQGITFDRVYPGHNEANWWDFFWPELYEDWQGLAEGSGEQARRRAYHDAFALYGRRHRQNHRQLHAPGLDPRPHGLGGRGAEPT